MTHAGQTAGSPCLIFRLGDVAYGLDMRKVHQILGCDALGIGIDSAAVAKGRLSLRGVQVPVFDLRRKFGTISLDGAEGAIIVLDLSSRVAAIVVDSISDVQALGSAAPMPAEADGTLHGGFDSTRARTLCGRAPMLIDIEQLMSAADLGHTGEHID